MNGIVTVPANLHSALFFLKRYLALSPRIQAELLALKRAVKRFGRVEVIWAEQWGDLLEEGTGRPYRWRPSEMVQPLSDELHAWFKGNAAKATRPVKRKRPNPWGLYDVHGNVWEWCNDFFSESYQEHGEAQDPRGPASGEERVMRGGSWATGAKSCRSSARNSETPRFADACFGTEAYGFRCVRRVAE